MAGRFQSVCVALALLPALLPALLGGSASLLASASKASCYFPDGTLSPKDTPCTSDETTHCCNSQNACLSIGYCMSAEQQPYVLSRSSCTSSSWATGCPTLCIGSNDNQGGGKAISWLGHADDNGNQLYCCGGLAVDNGTVACANSADPFTLDAASIIFGAGILANTTNTTADATATATTTVTASASSTNKTSSSGTSTTAVGAGVGVSLGVLSVTAVAWALWERRRRTKQVAALLAAQSDGYSSGTVPPSSVAAKYSRPHQLAELPGVTQHTEMEAR